MNRQIETFKTVAEGRYIGGFFTRDRAEYKRVERLRARGLVRLVGGRRYPFYNMFFEPTAAGDRFFARAQNSAKAPKSSTENDGQRPTESR